MNIRKVSLGHRPMRKNGLIIMGSPKLNFAVIVTLSVLSNGENVIGIMLERIRIKENKSNTECSIFERILLVNVPKYKRNEVFRRR